MKTNTTPDESRRIPTNSDDVQLIPTNNEILSLKKKKLS